MSELKKNLMAEVTCRKSPMSVAALVENYGPEAKRALWELDGNGLRLIATGRGTGYDAAEYGLPVNEFEKLVIEGDNEWFTSVEAA